MRDGRTVDDPTVFERMRVRLAVRDNGELVASWLVIIDSYYPTTGRQRCLHTFVLTDVFVYMRSRVNRYVDRIRAELRESFTQDYTPREVAGSFALGVFITMLPTLGVGLLVFVVLAYLFKRINKIALFASVLVLNPVVKWGVYAASVSLGFFLLGPVEGFDGGGVTLDDGVEVLIRLWVGNLILAAIATVISYPVAYRMATGYRAREMDVIGKTVDTVIEGFEDIGFDPTGSTSESPEPQADGADNGQPAGQSDQPDGKPDQSDEHATETSTDRQDTD